MVNNYGNSGYIGGDTMSKGVGIALAGISIIILFIFFCLWAYPKYRVYSQELQGKAILKEAEYSRQVAVKEAEAKYESSKMLAKAEVERAKGVAEANRIIGESLKNNTAYLTYLYIQALMDKDNNIIYVPTEAGLPILEAGKR